jgi:hypothetical protein|mmetsp:Transcript_68316/g.189777  ORF Transcript_68316/g.189777 Transcript_68316/m.189777 type:complete len:91 (-) Transcript_68316:218-490(-)
MANMAIVVSFTTTIAWTQYNVASRTLQIVRMKEKRRVDAAQIYAKGAFGEPKEEGGPRVVSSWGPYTQISGTATKTGVAGLTAKAKLPAT